MLEIISFGLLNFSLHDIFFPERNFEDYRTQTHQVETIDYICQFISSSVFFFTVCVLCAFFVIKLFFLSSTSSSVRFCVRLLKLIRTTMLGNFHFSSFSFYLCCICFLFILFFVLFVPMFCFCLCVCFVFVLS